METAKSRSKAEVLEPEIRTINLNETRSLDVEGCLVLFPRYMNKLMLCGKELVITGDKIGDRKACQLIVDRALNVRNECYCDVLIYKIEDKRWLAINITDRGRLIIKRKGYDSYVYYTNLRDFEYNECLTKHLVNALMNYVRIFSSASIKVL